MCTRNYSHIFNVWHIYIYIYIYIYICIYIYNFFVSILKKTEFRTFIKLSSNKYITNSYNCDRSYFHRIPQFVAVDMNVLKQVEANLHKHSAKCSVSPSSQLNSHSIFDIRNVEQVHVIQYSQYRHSMADIKIYKRHFFLKVWSMQTKVADRHIHGTETEKSLPIEEILQICL